MRFDKNTAEAADIFGCSVLMEKPQQAEVTPRCAIVCELLSEETGHNYLVVILPAVILPALFHFIVLQQMGVSCLWKHADVYQAQRLRKYSVNVQTLPTSL